VLHGSGTPDRTSGIAGAAAEPVEAATVAFAALHPNRQASGIFD
jgi:hypothetical protein